jgi:predicted nucleotide-binding protein
MTKEEAKKILSPKYNVEREEHVGKAWRLELDNGMTVEIEDDGVFHVSGRGYKEVNRRLQWPLRAVSVAASNRVFVVHGHDEGAREAVARFIEQIGFEPVVLHERANKGRTIITKFREEATDVGFAVVLMTPDDLGKPNDNSEAKSRARQNVVFELGFFIGALGSARVAALVKGNIERPSDFDGVVYIDLDAAGGWKQQLGRELQAAGFEVDWNKVMGP